MDEAKVLETLHTLMKTLQNDAYSMRFQTLIHCEKDYTGKTETCI